MLVQIMSIFLAVGATHCSPWQVLLLKSTIESSSHRKGEVGEDVSLYQLCSTLLILLDLKVLKTGQRRKEGSSISKSLLTLGTVKLQSRLEEEDEAKSALMGRIQRLTS